MRADPETARAVCVHDGTTVGFCCDGCKERFLAEPERYAHAVDPVCGASVERVRPGATARHEGQRFNNAQAAYHPVGTRKMEHDPMAVVDDRPRVYGVERPRAIDASIFHHAYAHVREHECAHHHDRRKGGRFDQGRRCLMG